MLVPGTRVGAYEIVSLLGAGGMGEVYRARDARLGRDVAIKVLPAALAGDRDRVERFSQEARAAAALNHPNILSVFDVVTDGDAPCIVSELLEGESLRELIGGSALPARKATEIAIQIATGLAAAHEKGIVHRDLKPDNVFVTADGRVKILDFGLAKLTQPEAALSGLTALPTTPPIGAAAPQTTPGMVMGTIGYMAPEQVRGLTTDHRGDIFALGVVLYEMVTGRRAFSGDTPADVMSAILRASPADIGSAGPPGLTRIVERCLEKQPGSRFQSARDLAFALASLSTESTSTAVPLPAPRRWRRWAVAGAILVVAMAAAVAGWTLHAPVAGDVARLSILTPPGQPVDFGWFPGRSIAISPDGRVVALAARRADARPGDFARALFLRHLGARDVIELPGTGGAVQPFFSPDGRWVAFFGQTTPGGSEYALRKVQVTGGTPITVFGPLSMWSTGVWLSDGTIVFSDTTGPLMRIPASGGTPQPVLPLAPNEAVHRYPIALPGERELLFAVGAKDTPSAVSVVTLATGARRPLVERANAPLLIPGGYLAFKRDDALLVAPFDPTRMTVGDPVPLNEVIETDSGAPQGNPHWAVSATGTLAYLPSSGDDQRALVLVSRDGTRVAVGERDLYGTPTASADGARVAVSVTRGSTSEIAVVDLARGTTTRVAGSDAIANPAWRPNRDELAVTRTAAGQRGMAIWLRAIDGSGERLLVKATAGVVQRNMGWSPDGSQLAYTRQVGAATSMWVVSADGGEPRPLAPGPGARRHSPRFSPDGRWLVYVSDDSGRPEVYVQSLASGARAQVSARGGSTAVWGPDGTSIYFTDLDSNLRRAPLTMTQGTVRAGDADVVMKMRVPSERGGFDVFAGGGNTGIGYAVLPDGRLLMLQQQQQEAREIVILQNFAAEAARLVLGQ